MTTTKKTVRKRKNKGSRKLTAKESLFCREYLIDLNASKAAIRAGYSQKTAGIIGFENLKKPKIQNTIQELQNKRAERLDISSDWVLKSLVANYEVCTGKRKTSVNTEDGVVESIIDYNANGANKCLELVGRHLGMFNDKLDVKGEIRLSDLHDQMKQRQNEQIN